MAVEERNGVRFYDCWAGNPKGIIEDKEHCVESVYNNNGFGHMVQCSRKRGYGKDKLYCKQHAKLTLNKE